MNNGVDIDKMCTLNDIAKIHYSVGSRLVWREFSASTGRFYSYIGKVIEDDDFFLVMECTGQNKKSFMKTISKIDILIGEYNY